MVLRKAQNHKIYKEFFPYFELLYFEPLETFFSIWHYNLITILDRFLSENERIKHHSDWQRHK